MNRSPFVILAACLAFAGLNGSAAADGKAQDVAYGAGSVVGTAVYAPFKATFCILGGLTSAFTYPFAGKDAAKSVATGGCTGTWWISPGVLKGQETVNFVGGPPSAERTTASKSAAAR